MTLADFVAIGLEIFPSYILLWCVLFLALCLFAAIFVGLLVFLLSRV